MTECDDIVPDTPEAELLGATVLDGEPLQLPANVKAELMACISSGGSENARADVVELSGRKTWVRRLAGAAAAVLLTAGGFAAGRAWTMHGVSDETESNALNQTSDYSQMSHRIADGHTIRLVWSYKEHSTALIMSTGVRVPYGEAAQA